MNDANLNALFLYNISKCAFKKADHGISAITQPTSACSSCNVMLKALRAETVETTQCVYTASLTANSRQLLAFIHIYNKKKAASILRKIPVDKEAYSPLVICPSIFFALFIYSFIYVIITLPFKSNMFTKFKKMFNSFLSV